MKKTLLVLAMAVGFNLANAQVTLFDDYNDNVGGLRSNYWNYYNSQYIATPTTNPSAVGNTSAEVGKYTRFVPSVANDEYQGLGCKQTGWAAFDFFTSYNAVSVDVYAAQAFSLSLVLQDNGTGNIDVLTSTQDYLAGDINTWKTLTFDFSSVSSNVLTPGNGYAILWKFDDGIMNTVAREYYVDNFVGKTVTTTALKSGSIDQASRLSQNSPNPFSAATTINYSLKQANTVSLSVYDALGKPVASIMNNQVQGAGDYNYNFNAEILREGVYYYTLTVGELSETKRMVVQK